MQSSSSRNMKTILSIVLAAVAAIVLFALVAPARAAAQGAGGQLQGFGGYTFGDVATARTFGGSIAMPLTSNIHIVGEAGQMDDLMPALLDTALDFTPVDGNWPKVAQGGSYPNTGSPKNAASLIGDCDECVGSIIEAQNQTLGETLPLVGTGQALHYRSDRSVARARREVILAGGAFNTPQLLMLSGIGDPKVLSRYGISARAELLGVGRNLQDHVLLAGLVYESKGPLPPLRNNGAESTLWWKSNLRLIAPDIQPVFIEFPLATAEVAARLPHDHCYTIAPSVVRPASRGSVTLSSDDAAVAPIIDVNFLSRDADVTAMLAAVELCREIGASDAFRPFRAREVIPGPLGRTAMIEFIRNTASTYFHPTSTCRMGHDAECVVNHQLKVYGIDGLRVADASIMPTITTIVHVQVTRLRLPPDRSRSRSRHRRVIA